MSGYCNGENKKPPQFNVVSVSDIFHKKTHHEMFQTRHEAFKNQKKRFLGLAARLLRHSLSDFNLHFAFCQAPKIPATRHFPRFPNLPVTCSLVDF
ncbi:MAG: hypothetical protein IJM51_06205 [Clostridia bacterium]|nr:hypothetical protein [Clostridia bacterium]